MKIDIRFFDDLMESSMMLHDMPDTVVADNRNRVTTYTHHIVYNEEVIKVKIINRVKMGLNLITAHPDNILADSMPDDDTQVECVSKYGAVKSNGMDYMVFMCGYLTVLFGKENIPQKFADSFYCIESLVTEIIMAGTDDRMKQKMNEMK